MKLITKTSRYFILYTIPVILFSGVFIYFFLLKEIGESNESILVARTKVIEQNILKNKYALLDVLETNDEVFIKVIEDENLQVPIITDTLIYSDIEKEYFESKMLTKSAVINGKNYQIKVIKSTFEFDELMEVVLVVFILLLFLLFLITVYINIKISKLIWKPFQNTLDFIKNFNVTQTSNVNLESSSITEFDELNRSINQMTAKMIADYKNQKKFTENASHEFQTPLAIIKGKIELLLQDLTLNEEALHLLIAIENATSRLSRINKSLLLLSKIENQQFKSIEKVLVLPLIESIIDLNEDAISKKNLKFSIENSGELAFNINAELCFMMVSNLVQNAIRHTLPEGEIVILLKEDSFSISNTAESEALNEHYIFERFEKNSTNSNSIGLGLSIVKEIAELYNLTISYSFQNQKHIFSIQQFA